MIYIGTNFVIRIIVCLFIVSNALSQPPNSIAFTNKKSKYFWRSVAVIPLLDNRFFFWVISSIVRTECWCTIYSQNFMEFEECLQLNVGSYISLIFTSCNFWKPAYKQRIKCRQVESPILDNLLSVKFMRFCYIESYISIFSCLSLIINLDNHRYKTALY